HDTIEGNATRRAVRDRSCTARRIDSRLVRQIPRFHHRERSSPMNARILLLAALPFPQVSSLPDSSGSSGSNARTGAASTPVADKPLEDYRKELLDVAFRAASAFPAHPHLKNRCRNQEAVVDASFQLDQPRRALGYVEK